MHDDIGFGLHSRLSRCPLTPAGLHEAMQAGQTAWMTALLGDGSPDSAQGPNRATASKARRIKDAFESRAAVFPPRAIVAQAGDPADRIYHVHSGRLCRVRYLADGQRQFLGIYLPGDIIGLEGLYWPLRSDAVETVSAATVLALDTARAQELLARHPEAALWLMRSILAESRRLQMLATSIGRARAQARIAWFLLELWRRLRCRGLIAGHRFDLPMTQQEIGDFLGLTPVHVNRVLKSLKDEGVVIVRRRAVTVHDATRLRVIAAPVICEA